MLSVAWGKTKGSKATGATTPGERVGESLLFHQIKEISGSALFLAAHELAAAARSGECDQPLCLSVLSGGICGVTWANRGQSTVWKNHYTEPDILDNFGGNRPPGTLARISAWPERPWMKHFLITPVRSLMERLTISWENRVKMRLRLSVKPITVIVLKLQQLQCYLTVWTGVEFNWLHLFKIYS